MSFLDEMFGLNHKTAIIAGGAGVIGTVMSEALLKAGANVVIWSRTQQSVDRAVEKLSKSGESARRILGDKVDTGDEARVAAGLEKAVSTFGCVEILVNAVGGTSPKTPLAQTDMNQFETTVKLNLLAGLMIPLKTVAGFWMEKKIKGTVINLASMASFSPLSGVWAYNAAKAAVLNLTVAAAAEFAGHGIRVNAIAPGFFLGKQNRALLVDEKTGEYTDRGKAVIAHTPFGRFGEAQELAGATLFLASNKASGFVTGICIPADGGYLAFNI